MKKVIFMAMITAALASCEDRTSDTKDVNNGQSTEVTGNSDSGTSGTADSGLSGTSGSPSAASSGIATGVAPTTGAGADSVDMGSSKGVKTQTGSSSKGGSKMDTTKQ